MMEVAITRNTQELERLEGIIRRNLQSFYEVGRALMEIRDKGLYRDAKGYATFEEYCKKEWDFSRIRAYQLIEAVEVKENVLTRVNIEPSSEKQIRPLVKLTPEKQREAWQQAVSTAPGGKVTAAHVYKIVKGMQEPEPQPKRRINQPIIKQELVSTDFQAAFDRMVVEIQNARAMKWRTTSHEGAIELMKALLTIAEQ